jgi:hypothetical protein
MDLSRVSWSLVGEQGPGMPGVVIETVSSCRILRRRAGRSPGTSYGTREEGLRWTDAVDPG